MFEIMYKRPIRREKQLYVEKLSAMTNMNFKFELRKKNFTEYCLSHGRDHLAATLSQKLRHNYMPPFEESNSKSEEDLDFYNTSKIIQRYSAMIDFDEEEGIGHTFTHINKNLKVNIGLF